MHTSRMFAVVLLMYSTTAAATEETCLETQILTTAVLQDTILFFSEYDAVETHQASLNLSGTYMPGIIEHKNTAETLAAALAAAAPHTCTDAAVEALTIVGSALQDRENRILKKLTENQ